MGQQSKIFKIEELMGAQETVTSVAQQARRSPSTIKGTPVEREAVQGLTVIHKQSAEALKALGAPLSPGSTR